MTERYSNGRFQPGHKPMFKVGDHTEEAKQKISETHKGRPKSEEHRRKLSEVNLGKHLPPEQITKLKLFNQTHRNAGMFKPGSSNPWNRGLKTPPHVIEKMRAARRRKEVLEKVCAARARQIFPKKDSSIEVALQLELAKRGIPFVKHKAVVPHHQCDLFIEPNIVVEADGETTLFRCCLCC